MLGVQDLAEIQPSLTATVLHPQRNLRIEFAAPWGRKGYQVTLFEDNNFKGKQVTLTSDLAHLKSIKFNDKISSIIIEKYDKNSDAAIIYDNTDYGGLMYPLKVGIYSNLKKQTWLNDKATSVKINPGYRIVAYEHYDFKGFNIIISENQANLKTIKWNDKISSFLSLIHI